MVGFQLHLTGLKVVQALTPAVIHGLFLNQPPVETQSGRSQLEVSRGCDYDVKRCTAYTCNCMVSDMVMAECFHLLRDWGRYCFHLKRVQLRIEPHSLQRPDYSFDRLLLLSLRYLIRGDGRLAEVQQVP